MSLPQNAVRTFAAGNQGSGPEPPEPIKFGRSLDRWREKNATLRCAAAYEPINSTRPMRARETVTRTSVNRSTAVDNMPSRWLMNEIHSPRRRKPFARPVESNNFSPSIRGGRDDVADRFFF